MASTINGTSTGSGGLISTGDDSGILNIQTNETTAITVDASQNVGFNSGYGSAATAYGCRAWVNFNGTGTVAIRGSGNVSSITDNGVGLYTANFTNSMPDANYCAIISCSDNGSGSLAMVRNFATASIGAQVVQPSGSFEDTDFVEMLVIR